MGCYVLYGCMLHTVEKMCWHGESKTEQRYHNLYIIYSGSECQHRLYYFLLYYGTPPLAINCYIEKSRKRDIIIEYSHTQKHSSLKLGLFDAPAEANKIPLHWRPCCWHTHTWRRCRRNTYMMVYISITHTHRICRVAPPCRWDGLRVCLRVRAWRQSSSPFGEMVARLRRRRRRRKKAVPVVCHLRLYVVRRHVHKYKTLLPLSLSRCILHHTIHSFERFLCCV